MTALLAAAIAITSLWMAIAARQGALDYELAAFRWYDPWTCYVIDSPITFSPNVTGKSRPGSRDHWREHGHGSSCPAAILNPSNVTRECDKLLLRKSILPVMMETMNSVTAHVQRLWEPVIKDLGSDWTYGSRDQYLRTRLSHVEGDTKILWDILAYRMSNGTEGAEITSKHMWRQLLKTPDIKELHVLSKPIWNLEILMNRNKKNLLPLIYMHSKEYSSRSSEFVTQAKEILEKLPNITEHFNSTLTDLRLLTHFLTHNRRRLTSHRKYYLRLRKKIRIWRHLSKVTRRIAKRRRQVKENMFIILRPYQRARSWVDKCRLHNETAERMRYRVTYGDIKSNVLDITSQLFWIKTDTRRARKILKRITPRYITLNDRVDQLWKLKYNDVMTDKMKAFLQAARNNFLELHGLSRQLNTKTPDLTLRCSYLDVIVSPTRYEKARVDLGLGKVLRAAAFAINNCQKAINASRPYTAMSAFMTRRYDDGYYAPIERLLDTIKDTYKRAAVLLEDSLTVSAVLDLTMRREGLLLASDSKRPGRHLLWFWEDDDDDDDDDKTTTTTEAPPTTIVTSAVTTTTQQATTARRRTKPRKTKKPTKPIKPTTTGITKPKPVTKPKPEKLTTIKPTPKASTIQDIVTEPQTDFYFDGESDDVTDHRQSPANEKSRSHETRTKDIRFFDDEDFGFSGSGLGSGDMEEEIFTTEKPVTSSTPPPTTTTAPPVLWVNWKAIRKLVQKSAKPLKKNGKQLLQRLNSIEKTEHDLFFRVNTTIKTHTTIKRSHKQITRNLDLKRLKSLDGKSDKINEAVNDVIKREEILRKKCQSMVFSKAPFMEKYKQTLINLDSYAQGSYTSMESEMKQLRRNIQDVENASTSLYKRALSMNDTIKELGRRMDILRDRIQTARLALAGIHPKVQVFGSATYTLQHQIKSKAFQPGSLHFKIRTNQPDGAIIAIQASGRSPLIDTRRINNRLAVGLHQGKVTVFIEPWRSKWTLPGVINDGRWHEISIYILDNNILMTESVMSNVYTGEYTEVQRRMYNVPDRIQIKQYFRKKYFFIIGNLPYASWPFNPDRQFRVCLSELRVGSYYLPTFLILTVNRTVAPPCAGELTTSTIEGAEAFREPYPVVPKELPLSAPFVNNLSNIYTLYGERGDHFMFHVWYTGQTEGGVVIYLALSPSLHISLHHRYGRIIVTMIEGNRYASAVCRTYGSDQSTHSIFAVAQERRVEFNVDCQRCQSLPFLSSISRHFPFYKPELVVAPTLQQLDYYLHGRPRIRRQMAPFNGVITRVSLDGVVLHNSARENPGCKGDLDISHLSRQRRRRQPR